MEPTRVFIPVSRVTPTAFPFVTKQLEKTIVAGVRVFTAFVFTTEFFATSSGSPVRSISFTFKKEFCILNAPRPD